MSKKYVYKYPLTPAVSSDVSIPNQNTGNEENEDTLVQEKNNVIQEDKINVLAEEERKNFINSLKSIHSENNIGYDMQYRFEDIAQKLTKFLKRDVTYWNTGNEENEDTLVQEKDNVIQEDKVLKLSSSKDTERPAEDIKVFSGSKTSSEKTGKKLAEVLKLLCYFSISSKDTEKPAEDIKVFSGSKTSSEKTGKKLAEDIKVFSGSKTSSEKTGKKLAEVLKLLCYFSISSKDTEKPAEDIKVFSGSKTSSEKTGKKLAEVLKLLCYFSISSKDTEKPAEDIKVFSGSKTSSEKTGKKLAEDIKFLSGSKTSSEKTGKKLAEDIKFLSGSKTSSEKTRKKLAEDIKFLSGSKTSSEKTGKKLAEDIKFLSGSKTSSEKTGKKLAEDIKFLSGSKTSSEKTGKKLAEDIKFLSGSKTSSEKTGKKLAEDIKFLSGSKTSSEKTGKKLAEDIKFLSGSKTSSEKTGKKLAEDIKFFSGSITSSEKTGKKLAEDIKFLSGSKTSSEKTGKKLAEDIKFLSGSKTSSEKTGKKLAEDIKFLSGSKTSSENTGKKLAEIKKVPSEGKTDTKSAGQITNSICARLITVTKMGGQIKYTTTEGPIAIINKFTSQIIDMININLMWQKAQTEVGCMKDVKNETNEKHIIYYIKESCREMTKYKEIEASKGMSPYIEQLERHKSTEASEGSTNRPIHPVDRLTTYNSQEDNRIGMRGSMINKTWFIQDNQILISEVNTDISSDESRSTFESTLIRLYRNVIRNDTSRMMSSIDMVGFKAEHLFGLERSRIFFDLLDEELCHFESAGAIYDFVPNMAESTVRQHVISFFEHAYDMMSRLMTLLSSCPYSKILQQMPVQNFISLMKSVIESSLKAQTKGREKLSLEGNIYIMVDPRDFERALVEEFPEDILNRLGNEDEIVVHRLYHYIYFPSDCRLYIYIPTATGSYWHHSDMRRADRIRRHG